MEPLALQLTPLRARLDGLRLGSGRAPSLWERRRGPHAAGSAPPEAPELRALDEALDVAGVHTSADAELLFRLGLTGQRSQALGPGLRRRAAKALREWERQLAWAERAAHRSLPVPGGVAGLERGLRRLARILKVADRFTVQDPTHFELWERPLPVALGGSVRLEAASFFANRARLEWQDVLQKQRDLETAHALLGVLGAEPDRDRHRIWALRQEVLSGRQRAQASVAVTSVQDSAQRIRRADASGAYRMLHELYERSVEAGEGQAATRAWTALTALMPAPEGVRTERRAEAAERILAFLDVPLRLSGPPAARVDEALSELAFGLTADVREAFLLAAECERQLELDDGGGDVESVAASPGAERMRVRHPAEQMTLETTGQVSRWRDFVLTDPRRLTLDLAAHQQAVRTYWENAPSEGPARRSAVRLYVCDASGSMQGARARFRDAVLLAELNQLRVRARAGKAFDPIYFCFFNDQPSELIRVASGKEALERMQQLFRGSPARGQTNITRALEYAFASIRAAAGRDPQLERAKVVLVTDGEDRLRMDDVRAARSGTRGVRLSLSFISVGEENADLRALAEEQRRLGERAFYTHLTDYEIGALRTEFDRRFHTLLPSSLQPPLEALEQLTPHLEALEALAATRPVSAPRATVASFDAFFPDAVLSRVEMSATAVPPAPAEVDRVRDIVAVLAEVAPLSSASVRAQDVVALLLHLLQVYGLSLPAYLSALGQALRGDDVAASRSRELMQRLRLLARPLT